MRCTCCGAQNKRNVWAHVSTRCCNLSFCGDSIESLSTSCLIRRILHVCCDVHTIRIAVTYVTPHNLPRCFRYSTLYLYQEPICRFLTTLTVRLVSAQRRAGVGGEGMLSVEQLFHLIGTLFMPFLATAQDGSGAPQQPWEDDPVQVYGASTGCMHQ